MTDFPLQTAETADPAAARILETAEKQNGFVPNLYATLANAPLALEAYTTLAGVIGKRSTLTPTEQQVAFISLSIENGCDYCVAAHSTIGAAQKVPEEVLEAVRQQRPLGDERLEAVRALSLNLLRKRGWLEEADLEAFEAAGFERAQALEVVTFLALKTISNYTNHIADTRLDAAFEPRRYERVA